MVYSDDMKFVDSHEWVKLDTNSDVVVGITEYAQGLLGDLVYVELPQLGQKVTSRGAMGVLESVKAASDLYAPVTGEVVAVNQAVIDDPTLINSSPHVDGWLVKIKLDNSSQLDSLMDAATYTKSIGIDK